MYIQIHNQAGHVYSNDSGTPYTASGCPCLNKQEEMALRKKDQAFRTLAENSPDIIARFNRTLTILYVNSALDRYTGHAATTYLGKRLTATGLPEPYLTSLKVGLDEAFHTGRRLIQEIEIHVVSGKSIFFEVSLVPEPATNGSVKSVLVIGHDITEQKEAEERIRRMLADRAILLKEMHHRVNNNLQFLSSLLKLQADSIQDPHALALYQNSQTQIRSIAILQEYLYRSDDLAQIDFAAFLQKLTIYLYAVHNIDSNNVHLTIEGVPLAVDVAIPCALIANELLSHTLKLVAPTGSIGQIAVRLSKTGERQYCLEVAHDGIELQSADYHDWAANRADVVNILVQQLGGDLEVDRTDGTIYRLLFTVE